MGLAIAPPPEHSGPMSDGKNLEAHLFVCTNTRETGESCSGRGSLELREQIKKICQEDLRGWHGRVRINTSGCLGRCKEGITAVMYPEGKWLTHMTKDSLPEVEKLLSETLDQ